MIAVGFAPELASAFDAELECRYPAPDYVAGAFRRGDEVRMLDVGVCACGFFKETIDAREARELGSRYRAEGWTASQIERRSSDAAGPAE